MELAECSLFQLLHEPIDTDTVKFDLGRVRGGARARAAATSAKPARLTAAQVNGVSFRNAPPQRGVTPVGKLVELSWLARLNLAVGCARSIVHLHSQSPAVCHSDVKSLNFLSMCWARARGRATWRTPCGSRAMFLHSQRVRSVTRDFRVKICDLEHAVLTSADGGDAQVGALLARSAPLTLGEHAAAPAPGTGDLQLVRAGGGARGAALPATLCSRALTPSGGSPP
jgi:hypothetical protein